LINNFVVQVERDKERKKTDKPKKEDKYWFREERQIKKRTEKERMDFRSSAKIRNGVLVGDYCYYFVQTKQGNRKTKRSKEVSKWKHEKLNL
jgi:biotin synthase-like enzyme